jgi:pimeloyl-ACP methyl ester carboxylesterase
MIKTCYRFGALSRLPAVILYQLRGLAVAVAVISLMSPSAFASAPAAADRPPSNGIVYLFRGGFNVFSTGVDVLAKQLRARGIDATAYGNADWPAVTEKATTRYTATHQPIILVGHSFGANAAVLLAAQLDKARIPVALIVLYDTVSSMKVTGNVRRVVDFVSSDGRTMGVTVAGEPDFAGHIDRIEARQGHFTVDKDPRNHDISIAAILRVVK